MRKFVHSSLALLAILAATAVSAAETRLLRRPAVSCDLIAFAHAGDLWTVPRGGGAARRLTSTPTVETDPRFSPDGSQIAFTATVGGNPDVYVMPASGGTPRRVTFHPGLDYARGWTPDGRAIVFASSRNIAPTPMRSSFVRLWTIGLDAVLPQPLAMPRAYTASYSPDGGRIAYEEFSSEFETLEAQEQSSQWRRYRGGKTHPIRIIDLDNHAEAILPWTDSNDSDPMWIGNTIYFLSDRDGVANLYAFHPASKKLTQITKYRDSDIMNASAGPDALVFEQAGTIHLYEIASGTLRDIAVQVEGAFPWAEPQEKDVGSMVRSVRIAPDGKEVAIEARGDIFTMKTEDGSATNRTHSSNAHDRDPLWSPDGKSLAWLSDESGEYQLFIGRAGAAEPRAIDLPQRRFYWMLAWSPDGRRLLMRDSEVTLWSIEIATGKATRIDADTRFNPLRLITAAWSPDSDWIAYSKNLANHQRAIFLHSIRDGSSYQLTSGLEDSTSPAFDATGRYLYFLVSHNSGLRAGWINLSSTDRLVTSSIHAAVLSRTDSSPMGLAPARQVHSGRTDVDFDGLSNRVIALKTPQRDYAALEAGPPGIIYYSERPPNGPTTWTRPPLRLYRMNVGTQEEKLITDSLRSFSLSSDRQTLLYKNDDGWGVAPLGESTEIGKHLLPTDALRARVDPRQEWREIFHEAWRNQRDLFYQPEMHGVDWEAVHRKYLPLLAHVNHRDDLRYLLATVGGELSVGHSGTQPPGEKIDEPVNVGMLAADYEIEQDRYRFKHIYRGNPLDPRLQAPLNVPGLDVSDGDYLLEVNGKPLTATTNVYSLFERTADKPTRIRVNSRPVLEGSRLVTVTPIANDEPLRTHENWIERNRRMIDRLSDGRLAYVWLPNVGWPGYHDFNREYFAQLDKEGLILDIRYNQGGDVPDYIITRISELQTGYYGMRVGKPFKAPTATIYGPRVLLINESAGSGGDALAYDFRFNRIGPIVGTRSWGGLVGASQEFPPVLDGGGISVPDSGYFDLAGRWSIENEGVVPDIVVENKAAESIEGRDLQLEAAIAEAMRQLEAAPPPNLANPASVDRSMLSPPN